MTAMRIDCLGITSGLPLLFESRCVVLWQRVDAMCERYQMRRPRMPEFVYSWFQSSTAAPMDIASVNGPWVLSGLNNVSPVAPQLLSQSSRVVVGRVRIGLFFSYRARTC